MRALVVHPLIRLVFPALVLVASIMSPSAWLLVSIYGFGLLPWFLVERKTPIHLKFLLYGVFPILVTAYLIYGLVLHIDLVGWHELALKGARFLVLTTAIQWALIIPNDQLTYTFKGWGLKGNSILVALGAFILWADLQKAANRIVTARLASGMVADRSKWVMLRQLPAVLLPMIIALLRTATVRSLSWSDKDITALVGRYQPQQRASAGYNVIILVAGFVILASTWWVRL